MATNNSGGSQGRESRPKTNNYGKDGKSFSGENREIIIRKMVKEKAQGITDKEQIKTQAVIEKEMTEIAIMGITGITMTEMAVKTGQRRLIKVETATEAAMTRALTKTAMRKRK